jgi:hypothetical protein
MKVALIVPAATRGWTQTAALPTGCFGTLSFNPAPQGEIFAQTVLAVLQQKFDEVVAIDALPAPADARLIVEATLSAIGIKPACPISPEFFAEADGALRVLNPDGSERRRSIHTSARDEEPMPVMSMDSYHAITPKAMANLASDWANELAQAAAAQRPQPDETSGRAPDAQTPGSKPWWQK